MKYGVEMNESNCIKGIERVVLLTLEKGLKLKAQGEALIELVKATAETIITSKGVTVESGEKSERKLVWVKKDGKQYPITCTKTVRAGTVDWKATAELYATLLRANGIEVSKLFYNDSTTSHTYGFDGHEHKKAYEKKQYGNDLKILAQKLGIEAEKE